MTENFYGKLNQVECNSDIDLYVEEIKNNGFTIIENVLSEDELKVYRQKIDEVYKKQEDNFEILKSKLKHIQDLLNHLIMIIHTLNEYLGKHNEQFQ